MAAVIVELSANITYAHQGEKQEADFVHIIAPNFKQMSNFIPIKQAFTSAVTDLAKSNQTSDVFDLAEDGEDGEDGDITGGQALVIMMQSKEDMTKVFLFFAELLKSGVALIGGEQKLTQLMIDIMPLGDFEKLLGAYIANFIVPSLKDGL